MRCGRVVACNDAALEPRVALAPEHVARDGIEHLVGEHRAIDRVGQRVDPLHERKMRRRGVRERHALALAQVGAALEDEIARWQRVLRGEAREEARGEPAGARAELHDLARARGRENGRDLPRERFAEERRHLRRGHEIAGRAQLGGPRRVVAEARRIERELHVARERKPPSGIRDGVAHALRDAFGMGPRIGIGQGEIAHDRGAIAPCARLPQST